LTGFSINFLEPFPASLVAILLIHLFPPTNGLTSPSTP
jgi:hypothetical protein